MEHLLTAKREMMGALMGAVGRREELTFRVAFLVVSG